jgi:predicted RNase H-like HicB family nuclease
MERVTGGTELMRYAVVIKKAEGKYSAQVPDLPGCVAMAASVAEAQKEIGAAVRLHLARLERDGLPAPEPTTVVEYVDA